MNKTFLTLVLSALLLSACGSPPAQNNSSTTTPSVANSTDTPKKTAVQSIKDLMSSGIAQKCTWNTVLDDGTSMSGSLLIKGQQFKQTISSVDINTTNISDGTNFYSWSSQSKTGFKMNIAETQKNTPTSGENQQGSVDWNKEYNYDCSPTTVTDADFTLPTDVTFTDFSETMKGLQNLDLEKLKQQYGGE